MPVTGFKHTGLRIKPQVQVVTIKLNHSVWYWFVVWLELGTKMVLWLKIILRCLKELEYSNDSRYFKEGFQENIDKLSLHSDARDRFGQ